MGAAPRSFFLGFGAPRFDPEFCTDLFSGMAQAARDFGLTLAGGDLVRSPVLSLAITVIGEPGPSGRTLGRGPVNPGDVLFVAAESGPRFPLGLAGTGLWAFESFGRDEARIRFPAACAALLRPIPRLAQGTALAAESGVHGLMDLSDGLAADLPRLLAYGRTTPLGADLALDPDRVHPEIFAAAKERGLDPLDAIIACGEDYALLAAVSPDAAGRYSEGAGFWRIGTVADAAGIRINGRPLQAAGFDHFA